MTRAMAPRSQTTIWPLHVPGGNGLRHCYTEDLDHLGRFYTEYERIMRHWREVLDIEIREVSYEELVVNQEMVSRRILDHCGLPWDDRVLRFYETKREVITLSREQVSQPLYLRSVGRYHNYEAHLGPLKAALIKGGWTEETLREAASV